MELKDIYYDVRNPASYGSVRKLWLAARKYGYTQKQVKEWLQSQDTYTLHKQKRKRFRRVKTITKGLNDLWQVDLADVGNLAKQNDGVKFLLVIIDVLSKYLRVVPLKSKHAQSIYNAMKVQFEDTLNQSIIFSDRGTEFTNNMFKELCNRI